MNYAYDGRGEIAAVSGGATASYDCDAEGRRVEGDVGGMVKQYLYGVGGRGLTITDGCGNLMSGETYFGGRYAGASTHSEMPTETPSGFIYAYADGLGSEHVRSTGEKDTNWPFGEFPVFQNGISPVHFTGKPYDSETGLDYFGARYYAPTLGRFLTPDWSATPEPIPYANSANPQSLNLYSYVLNNPTTNTDPNGHVCLFGFLGNTCTKPTKAPVKEGAAAVAGTDALTGGLDTTAILDGLQALGDAATVASGEFAVVFAVINSPGDADPELLAREKSGPKPSPRFQQPTNAPQAPPEQADIPPGHKIRVMGPTAQYPDGYWVETNENGQPVDPSTGKPPSNVTSPEARARTHVPLPAGYHGGL